MNQNSFEFSGHTGLEKCMEPWILKKYSVSFNMALLAIGFMVCWMFVLLCIALPEWNESFNQSSANRNISIAKIESNSASTAPSLNSTHPTVGVPQSQGLTQL